jgi:hypothetical protein
MNFPFARRSQLNMNVSKLQTATNDDRTIQLLAGGDTGSNANLTNA